MAAAAAARGVDLERHRHLALDAERRRAVHSRLLSEQRKRSERLRALRAEVAGAERKVRHTIGTKVNPALAAEVERAEHELAEMRAPAEAAGAVAHSAMALLSRVEAWLSENGIEVDFDSRIRASVLDDPADPRRRGPYRSSESEYVLGSTQKGSTT